MRSTFRIFSFCAFLATSLLAGMESKAQLTGAKTVPSTAYPTLKVAIDSLNQYGVGTGA